MDKKQCFICKKVKELDKFYRHVGMSDGRLNKCKSCVIEYEYNRYRNPLFREKIREYERKRFQDPERRKKLLIYQRNRRRTHRGKNRARHAIAIGIKNGKIIRQPCEVCGDIKSQAHHTDYRKYYDVKWLCFKHHREAHRQLID